MSDDTTIDPELIELLQFQAAGVLTVTEVRARVKALRPEWFEGDE